MDVNLYKMAEPEVHQAKPEGEVLETIKEELKEEVKPTSFEETKPEVHEISSHLVSPQAADSEEDKDKLRYLEESLQEEKPHEPKHEPWQDAYAPHFASYASALKTHVFMNPLHTFIMESEKFLSTRLSNWMMISGDFVSENKLSLNGSEIQDPRFNWRSRCMSVSKNQVLMTGGTGHYSQVLLLDTVRHNITHLSSLGQGRDLHAMTWIDGCPAVIGGSGEYQEALDSVEVLQTVEGAGKWVSRSSIKHKRYGLSACSIAGRAWIIGGASSAKDPVLAIEVYEHGDWRELEVKLSHGLVGIGLLPVEHQVYIFGGFNEHKNYVDSVYSLDIEKETISSKAPLDKPTSFSQNLWSFKNKVLEGTCFRGNKFSYSLD